MKSETILFSGGLVLMTLVAILIAFTSAARLDCYLTAVDIAQDAVDTTEDLASVTSDSLINMVLGLSYDEAGLDRVGDAHDENRDALASLTERCG